MLEKLLAYIQALFSIISPCPTINGCESCVQENFEIRELGHLPTDIEESSGIVIYDQLLFTNTDSGNEPNLSGVSSPFTGDPVLKGSINLPHLTNNDWEDLTIDSASFIYIGDFGNNANHRTNLSIIKFDPFTSTSEKISFSYEDQVAFPPKKRIDQNFDCEAFFWAKDSLYLFSKNKKSNEVKVYSLPDSPGQHVARVVDTLKLDFPVTSADISPDGQTMALLSYGKIFLYSLNWEEKSTPSFTAFACINFSKSGQSEAIAFVDKNNWLITNEAGKIFWMRATDVVFPKPESSSFPEISLPPIDQPVFLRY